jgi:hypothetical protein
MNSATAFADGMGRKTDSLPQILHLTAYLERNLSPKEGGEGTKQLLTASGPTCPSMKKFRPSPVLLIE